MGSTYGSGEKSRFGESELEMVLGITLGAEVGVKIGPNDEFLGGNNGRKYEDYFGWETILLGSSGVFIGGCGEEYPLVELLGLDGGSEIVSTIGMSEENRNVKTDGYSLVKCTFVSETIREV